MITETWQWMVIVGECTILALMPLFLIVWNLDTHRRQVQMLKEAKRCGK